VQRAPRQDARHARSVVVQHFAPALILLLASAVFFLRDREYGFVGWDTYPVLASTRVTSLGDIPATLTKKLMDGRYPYGDFHRPLLSLSIAIDYALFGLEATGYHLTNALLFGAFAAALYALSRQLSGGAALAPIATLVVFLCHPSHVEVVPVLARRPELLCGLWMALALCAQFSPRALAARRLLWLPAALGALALASKEAAYPLAGIVFLAVCVLSPRLRVQERLWHALSATVPHAIVLAAALALRFAVLGHAGGHLPMAPGEVLVNAPFQLALFVREFVLPAQLSPALLPLACVTLAVLSAVALLVVMLRSGHSLRTLGREWIGGAAWVGICWVLLIGLAYAPNFQFNAWYVSLVLAGFSLAAGAVIQRLWDLVRTESGTPRVLACTTLAFVGALVLAQARVSPLVYSYDAWRRGSAASADFFGVLGPRIQAAPNGALIEGPPLPVRLRPRRHHPSVQSAVFLLPYTVQAWADLTFPTRRVKVFGSQDRDMAVGPDEVGVKLVTVMSGFSGAPTSARVSP